MLIICLGSLDPLNFPILKDLLDAYRDTLVRLDVIGMQRREGLIVDSLDNAVIYSTSDSKYTVNRISLPCTILLWRL